MGLTIDQLYEAYMDIDEAGEPTIATDFARDVFEWFKPEEYVGMTPGQWAQEYGMYIAPFDPTATYLGERERDLEYKKSLDLLQDTKEATDPR